MLDTGPIVGLLRSDDPDHGACVEALTSSARSGRVLTTIREVVGEAYTLIRYRFAISSAPALTVLEWAKTAQLVATEDSDHTRAAAILRRHGDLRLSYVDALLLSVTERHRADEILTLDAEIGAVRLNRAVTVTVL